MNMASGPSKEELQYYYQNNRQYFDSLAKYYADTDREYYNKFIAPFYSTFRPQKGSARSVIAVMLFILIMGAAAGVFFMVKSDKPQIKENIQRNRELIEPNIKIDTVKPPVEIVDSSSEIVSDESEDYEKGMKYYHKLDYANAEKYFNRVPENNRKYKDAQKKLFELKFIKNALEKQTGNENIPNENKNRKQPFERNR